MRNRTRRLLVLGLLTAFVLLPVGSSRGLVVQDTPSGCTVAVVGSCNFHCVKGDFIRITIQWTGTASATCGNGGAECIWGIDHLVTLTECDATGSQAQFDDDGVCSGTVIATATCTG